MQLVFILLGMGTTGSILLLLYCLLYRAGRRLWGVRWHFDTIKLILIFWCIPVGAIVNCFRSEQVPDSAFRILYQVQNVFSVGWIKSDFMPVLIECCGKVSLQANVWKAVILTVWIAGFLVILIRQMIQYRRLCRKLRYGTPVLAWERAFTVLLNLKAELRIKQPVRLAYCPNIPTPASLGFLHPVIMLPDQIDDETKLRLILHHEMLHIRHRDYITKQLCLLVQCVFWFIPFSYLLIREAERGMELYCDSLVVQNLTANERLIYAQMLIQYSVNRSSGHNMFISRFASREKQMKERIQLIMKGNIKLAALRKATFCLGMLGMAAGGSRVACASSEFYVADVAQSSMEESAEPEAIRYGFLNTEIRTEPADWLQSGGYWIEIEADEDLLLSEEEMAADAPIESRHCYIMVSEPEGVSEQRLFCFSHSYTDKILFEHIKYTDGSCRTNYYSVLLCAKCGHIESMEFMYYDMSSVCRH